MPNETPKPKNVAVNNDAALRAAQERAAKAERELAEAKKQLATTPRSAPPKELPRKKVSGRFVVGPRGHYRAGAKYETGEVIVIENEIPGSDWTPVEESEKSAKGKAKKAAESDVDGEGTDARDANTPI